MELIKPILAMEPSPDKSDCVANHGQHDTLTLELDLNGKHHGLLDMPGIPERLAQRITFKVFNHKKYHDVGGYCPADDEVSRSIYIQGVWEAFETSLFLDILDRGNRDNVVIDVGANLGWYTVLANKLGYHVAAFEPDLDIYEILKWNCYENQKSDLEEYGTAGIAKAWVNEKTPQLSATAETVEFLKVDIEGMEKHAVKMCEKLFEAKKINYALIEISPCFNDSYPDLVEQIAGYGYKVYMIPHKGDALIPEYENEPLETLLKYCEVKPEGRRELVNSFRQENFIFINDSL